MATQKKNSGAVLWEQAKRLIPGGNGLLSKRPGRFLPDLWPTYYKRCKGCEVWDLDGNHYYDFAQMGVGACALGYADDEVDAAVTEAITNGSMCSLNCTEEVELAEKLVSLHPWAEMARFTRSGGEACAMAIRIARAAKKKSKIAFCGYHGWHDWYLAANISDPTNLDQQLLAGLAPVGVPAELRGSILPFNYNKLDEFQRIISAHGKELAAIIMEPERGTIPAPGFLTGVRKIATELGVPLIFDEVTSGFRVNVGGIHLTKGVDPDIAIFAKALGNGFPIGAVIGKRSVMDAAQDSFISSTTWTERVGFVAALATIKKMEQHRVPSALVIFGERIRSGWEKLGEKHGINLHVTGIAPLLHLGFEHPEALSLQTLYAQEMLGRGYLVGAAVYTTFAYTDKIIDAFLKDSDASFAILKQAIDAGSITKYLKSEIISPGFKRLT